MGFFDKLKADLAAIEPILDKLLHLGINLEPLAEVAEVATGNPELVPITKQAAGIATAVDAAANAHVAAGQTPQSAAAGAVAIDQAVAASGVVDAETSAKIQTITAALAPAVQGLVMGG